ncbi:MAG: end-binding protein Ku [Candidatus Sulfotelmatobacter sp.]|nr:end-binding protein Ku [Candidatus Sulfotelmatobacter sp.]
MPSAAWRGHLHFGLVLLPVRLLVAARTKTTRFRRLFRKPVNDDPSIMSFPSFSHDGEDHDSDPNEVVLETRSTPEEMNGRHVARQYSTVRQVLQSEETGQEIRQDEVVKGYEIAPNEFAAIDPQEIGAAEIETSHTIDLFHFVKVINVDPIYFERSYYVVPDSGAEKVYALLLEVMRKEECIGIARIGMHRREHMLILRPSEDCLVAHTMFYANEVRPAPHLELSTEFSEKELSMATALVKGYEGEFDPTQFKDLYQERIHEIIDSEMSNLIETRKMPTSPRRDAPDLIEQIRLSLAQIESKKPHAKPSKKPVHKTPTFAKKKPQRARA